MNKVIQCFSVACPFFLLFLYPSTVCAQYVPIVGGITMIRKLANGEYTNRTVISTTYRGQQLVTQRAITSKLSGAATDQIAFLEAQLGTCYTTMLSDSLATICADNQLAVMEATQAIIAKARPLWNQQYYHNEIAFYLAEDARRQRAHTPAKKAE